MKTEIEGHPRRGNPASRHLYSVQLCAAFYTRYEPCQCPRRLSPGDAPSMLRSGRLREAPEPPLLRGYATATFLSLFRGGVCEKLSTTPSKRDDAVWAAQL